MRQGIPQFMGARIRRREDPALITGEGQYVADIQLDNVLHMAIVRSPYAHANILSIDTSQAEAMDGVVAVLTANDVNPNLAQALPMVVPVTAFPDGKDPKTYALSADKVRYMGEPVAVVVAESRYIAADAVDLVDVEYEPLRVVADPLLALADDAPVLHWDDNVAYRWGVVGGDVDKAFEEADTVVELELENQRVIPNAMEPRAVAAKYDSESKGFTIWTTTQIPHAAKDELAGVLGIPAEQVRVIAPEVGGGFGAKGNVYGEEVLVPFLARKLGQPVRWVATRSEDYVATVHGRAQHSTIRLAANNDGRVLGVDLSVLVDCGAYYSRVTPVIVTFTGQMMAGVYDIRHVRTMATAVFTNRPPIEPYRGAGRPEAIYYIERGMDALANELGMDPAELRRRNFIAPDKFPYKTATNITYDSGDYEPALDKALELIDYPALRAEQARRREAGGKLMGVGLAAYVEICGFGPFESGTVTVESDAKVTVLSGTSAQGQGHQTAWAQIASHVLQIPAEDITVKQGDTGVVPRGVGTFGSRSAAVGGSAVMQNAETVRDKAKEVAAHLMEAASGDMELANGRFQVKGVPGRSVGWQEVAQAAYQPSLPEELRGALNSDEDFKPKGETYPFGVHVAVVEVDPDTGEVEITRYLTVDDCGRVINPLLVDGQVHGGIAQGIGQALYEGTVFDDVGNLLTGSLMDYALPRAKHFPSYETHRTETPSPLNPLGIKGIGEAATIGSTPTIVNAVVDALSHLGVRHIEMPLTSKKVWEALQSVNGN